MFTEEKYTYITEEVRAIPVVYLLNLETEMLDELEKTIKGALKVANGGSDPNPECSVCSGKLEFMKGRLEAGFTNFFV